MTQIVQNRALLPSDQNMVAELIAKLWGEDRVVGHGQVYVPSRLPGFWATSDGKPVGLLTYHLEGSVCEVVTIDSFAEVRGVGTVLLEAVRELAQSKGYKRLWLVTTNDNLEALAFYQKRGFRLVAVYPGAVDEARKIKPSIPLVAENGIPIRDELELELRL